MNVLKEETLRIAASLPEQDFSDDKKRQKFFEEVERHMLQNFLHISLRNYKRTPYLQMAPILNKIDLLLTSIMAKLQENPKPATNEKINDSEADEKAFLWACNILYRVVSDHKVRTDADSISQDSKSELSIPFSYLDRLVEFLNYWQAPQYFLRVSDLALLFAYKLRRKDVLHNLENLVPFAELIRYGTPFLKLFAKYDPNIDNMHSKFSETLQCNPKDVNTALGCQSLVENIIKDVPFSELQRMADQSAETNYSNTILPKEFPTGEKRTLAFGCVSLLIFATKMQTSTVYPFIGAIVNLWTLRGNSFVSATNSNKITNKT